MTSYVPTFRGLGTLSSKGRTIVGSRAPQSAIPLCNGAFASRSRAVVPDDGGIDPDAALNSTAADRLLVRATVPVHDAGRVAVTGLAAIVGCIVRVAELGRAP